MYLPLTDVLVHAIGWRSALRAEAGTVSFACLAAAAVLTERRPMAAGNALGSVSSALRGAWGQPGVRRWVVAVLIGTAATDLMLTYQVAIMVAFGLSATVAAGVAGLRGLAQLGGRLPLGVVLRHSGTRPALVVAHLVAVASAGALLLSGRLWAAIVFSVLAGISLGAITSLQGLYTKELIDPQHFGALFGALQGFIGIGGAAGPALGGLVLDLGGSHRLIVIIMTLGLAVAIAVLATGPHKLAGRSFTYYRRLTMIVDRDRAELFAGWFRCLADPTRIQILSLLASERRPMSVGEIVAAMDVGQSTVSEHLRRLAETCFVHVEHRGTASLFLVNQGCIEALPSAAELVMGDVEPNSLPAPRPGATSRAPGAPLAAKAPQA